MLDYLSSRQDKGKTLGEAFEIAEREMLASLQCEDFKEGVAHFVEKRAAAFTGK